jgi:hypothetical protein
MTEPPNPKICVNCAHWFKIPDQPIDDGRSLKPVDDGFCQRFPPQIGVDFNGRFPITRPTLTCGEYTARTVSVTRTPRLREVKKPAGGK